MKNIQIPPLDNHKKLTSGELLKTLFEAGDWTYEQVAEELDISVDSVKKWCAKNVIPKHYSRDKLITMLEKSCTSEDIAKQWKDTFTQSWMKQRITRNTTKQPAQIISGATQQHVLENPEKTETKDKPASENTGQENFIYLAASAMLVLTGIYVYSLYPSGVFYTIQLLLIIATTTSLTIFLCLFAIKRMKTVLIWFILKTTLLGLLLLGYFEFFPDNDLNGRLVATIVISPLILLLMFNMSYLLFYFIHISLKQIDEYQILSTLMRAFIRYRKNIMRLLELKWLFAAGSFAILAVANLNLLLPALAFIVK